MRLINIRQTIASVGRKSMERVSGWKDDILGAIFVLMCIGVTWAYMDLIFKPVQFASPALIQAEIKNCPMLGESIANDINSNQKLDSSYVMSEDTLARLKWVCEINNSLEQRQQLAQQQLMAAQRYKDIERGIKSQPID